ncbi:hypothetical protein [Streptomyces decoyicus]
MKSERSGYIDIEFLFLLPTPTHHRPLHHIPNSKAHTRNPD